MDRHVKKNSILHASPPASRFVVIAVIDLRCTYLSESVPGIFTPPAGCSVKLFVNGVLIDR